MAQPQLAEPLPVAQPRLKREDLIVAALNAATAAALGRDDRATQAALRGRRFQARIRFGCGRPSETATTDGWSYDAEQHVLRVRASANVPADAMLARDFAEEGHEGAVGFSLRPPLLMQAGCPKPELEPLSQGPAIEIVQLFTSADSRVQRPPPSYDMTIATDPAELPKDGLDLVVEGRLEPLADMRTIHCSATGGPPACLISAKIDRVAVEDPAREALLGEWSPG